jgi:hypothetical protein
VHIITVDSHDIEGAKLHLAVLLPEWSALKSGDAIDTQDHRLAINHELFAPVPQRRINDPGEAPGPVTAPRVIRRTRSPSRSTRRRYPSVRGEGELLTARKPRAVGFLSE